MKEISIYLEEINKRLTDKNDEICLALSEIIIRGKKADHWGHNEDGIAIGTAKDLAEFSTLLFHEAGHGYLGKGASLSEEEDCYTFSQEMCHRLDLPFSHEVSECGFRFAQIATSCKDEESFVSAVESLPLSYRSILVF